MSVLSDSLNMIRSTKTEKIIIALSGGKDSILTLDLCAQVFPPENIECFFMYFVKHLDCIDRVLNYLVDRYKVKLHYVPHFLLANFYKHGVYRPKVISLMDTADTRIQDIKTYIRDLTGIEWMAFGLKKCDGIHRALQLKGHEVDFKMKTVYPIANWKHYEVVNYLKMIKMIELPVFTTKKNKLKAMTEAAPTLESALCLKQLYPSDYQKMLEKFPFLEAAVKREEFKEERNRDNIREPEFIQEIEVSEI